MSENKTATNIKKPSEHSAKVQKSIMDRLNRAEGQIRGIRNMIENESYCDAVINQIEAVRSALSAIELVLLESHLKHCIAVQLRNGNDEVIEETLKTIKKLIK